MRQDRLRHEYAQDQLDWLNDEAADATPAMLLRTTVVATYPTGASSFYAVNPVFMDGAETEGSTAAFHEDVTRTFYALNLGTVVPPQGTIVIGHSVGGRFVFRYDG